MAKKETKEETADAEKVQDVEVDASKKVGGGAEATTSAEAEVKLSKNVGAVLDSVEKMSVLELNSLVKALEEKFGVSAQAPVAMAVPANGNGGNGTPAEEQSNFDVILTDMGGNKLSVIKAVRELNQNLGLKDAKDLVESAPKPVLEGANKEEAEEAKAKLEEAGAKAELK